ncbi:MAG: aldo/keto reductase [Nocardioides sp.]
MTIPALALRDGTTIPQLGFGVFQVPPARTAEVTSTALEVGYRHIDTAQMYGNEAGVGEAVRTSGIPREEIYLTSKLNNSWHRPDDARRAFDRTMTEIGSDYLDLFLIHWPLPTLYDGDYVSTWRTLAEFVADGRAKSVGVSNFTPAHLDRVVEETGVVPVVNQIEAHPHFGNEVVRAATLAHGTLVEAWAPIGQGSSLTDPVVVEIAERLSRTPAQVALRWHIERGDIVFPKSMRRERMAENLAIFDFSLSADDMMAVTALDRGESGRLGPDPDTFDWVPR